MEFGWSLGYTYQTLPVFELRTHHDALTFPSASQDCLINEFSLGRMAGPLAAPPFHNGFVVSPLNAVATRDYGFRVSFRVSFHFERTLEILYCAVSFFFPPTLTPWVILHDIKRWQRGLLGVSLAVVYFAFVFLIVFYCAKNRIVFYLCRGA